MEPSVPIAELLPHGPAMTLIDRLARHDATRSVALATVTADAVFRERDGVPAWAGLEYMAQTIAARAGLEARLRGEPPSIGFLLGARSYRCTVPEFPIGSVLTISVEPIAADARFASFACSIETDRVVATAIVSTYRPDPGEIPRSGGSV